MLDLENRVVVVSISVLSGCILFYNAWGPILAVIVSLFLVVYVCYSLITNDSLLSPHAFLLFDYLKKASIELRNTLANVIVYALKQLNLIWNNAKHVYRTYIPVRMDRRRGSRYQLSSDTSFCGKKDSASRFNLIPPVSPIPRNAHKHISSMPDMSENKAVHDDEYHSYNQHSIYNKFTSTPISQHKKDGLHNADARYNKTDWSSTRKTSPIVIQNHTLSRGENTTLFSPDGSPWGTSISPKMRSKAGGVKTVQTIAGPLLASTRYNIDPKTYTDVTSPGLTTRLTKYAAEANNKLTYQSQYSTGQFPKVNLHASPIPLINAKSAKIRGPVTVRVAPPETTRYSPPERQKILSSICHSENKTPPSVVQALREISLKRHASREDVTSDLVKKQRTDGIFVNDVENFEEAKQKRGRDESSKSEDDISPQNKSVRPTKRSKTPSCYDILRSLSSSIHVASGIKRKAADFSRSGTPDFEKHFKSLENMQNGSQTRTQADSTDVKQSELATNEKISSSSNLSKSLSSTQEPSPMKGILKTSKNVENTHETKIISPDTKNMTLQQKNSETSSGTKFTDKLFMRAEPQRNDKLRSLVEEQGNIKAKFTTNDVEEIKKEDIVNMRQTSMRARLQSMFDAISGKVASRINPDVVIQAEEVNVATPVVTSSMDCATLNSVTTTTNVNTTPITTSAVAPALTTSEAKTKPAKHITFNLPTTNEQAKNNLISNETSTSVITPEISNSKAQMASTTSSESSNVVIGNSHSTTSSPITPTFISGKTVKNTSVVPSNVSPAAPLLAVPVASSGVLQSSMSATGTSSNTSNTGNITMSTSSASSNIFTNSNTISNFTSVPATLDNTNTKANIGSPISQNVNVTGPTLNTNSTKFSFGNTVNIAQSTQANTSFGQNVTTSGISFTTETKSMALSTSNATTTADSAFRNITNNTISSTPNTSSVLTTTAATVPFIFGNSSAQTSKTEVSSFNTIVNNSPKTFEISGTTQPSSTPSTIPAITSSMPNSSMLNLVNGTFSGNVSCGSTPSMATPVFSFGTSNASMSENKSGFSYNANTLGNSKELSNNTPVTCSISSNTTPTFNVSSATTSSQFATTTAPMFNTASTTSIFQTTKSEPVFGQSIAAPIFGSSTKSLFVPIQSTKSSIEFGTNNNVFKDEKPSTFGGNTTVFGNTNTALFGSQTTAAPTFGSQTTAAPTFGSQTTAAPTFGSQTTAAPTFGSQTTSAPTFGSQTTSAPTFGSQTTSAPTFGSQTTSAPTFGSQTTSAPTFGSQTIAAPTFVSQTTVAPTFGTQTTAAPTFGSQTTATPTFGSQTTTAPTFGSQTTAAPTFGSQTTAAPTFGSSSGLAKTLTFGNTNTAAPAFGAPNMNVPENSQTSKPPSFGTPNPMFGNTNNPTPLFGATTTTQVGTFNTPLQNTFGSQSSNPISFGTTNNNNSNNNNNNSNNNAFGANKASPFGIQTTAAPAFGTNESNNTNNIFTFSGNQGQQQSTFSFGNNNASNNNTIGAGSVPFQFSGNTSKPAGGFNFTAPSTTPSINFGASGTPTFNASTPGMFSIGSGSTASRSRTVRGRKPR